MTPWLHFHLNYTVLKKSIQISDYYSVFFGESGYAPHLTPKLQVVSISMVQNLEFFQKGVHLLLCSTGRIQSSSLLFKMSGQRKETIRDIKQRSHDLLWEEMGRADPQWVSIAVASGTAMTYDNPHCS